MEKCRHRPHQWHERNLSQCSGSCWIQTVPHHAWFGWNVRGRWWNGENTRRFNACGVLRRSIRVYLRAHAWMLIWELVYTWHMNTASGWWWCWYCIRFLWTRTQKFICEFMSVFKDRACLWFRWYFTSVLRVFWSLYFLVFDLAWFSCIVLPAFAGPAKHQQI